MIIAVAKDEAFNFVYTTNIEKLEQIGQVVYFSPLADKMLPTCDLLYLPGGYPEIYAERLASNSSIKNSIKEFAEKGGKIYAECGGFMYLCEDIDNHKMCSVLPLKATMENSKLHLGYRQMEYKGEIWKGHEFHYSTIKETNYRQSLEVISKQKTANGADTKTYIYRYKNVIAGYTHWYWAEKDILKLWNKE